MRDAKPTRGTRRPHVETGVGAQIRPGSARVDILNVQLGLLQKSAKRHVGAILSHRTELFDLPASARGRRHGCCRGRCPARPCPAPCGSRRAGTGTLFDCRSRSRACRQAGRGSGGRSGTPCDGARRSRAPCSSLAVLPCAGRVRAAAGTGVGLSVGRSMEQRIDGRHVDAFVEQVDREDDVDSRRRQVPEGALPFGARAVSPHRD